MIIKTGNAVEILPDTGKDFDDDRIGHVESVDGSYIYVKRDISGVVVELYPNELRLLEGDENDMAYFTRALWRGLRTPEQNQAWLAEGYMRKIDWEAAQEENVTMSYDPLDTETTEFSFPHPERTKGSHVKTLPTRLNLLNDRCQKKEETSSGVANSTMHGDECQCTKCWEADLLYFRNKIEEGFRVPEHILGEPTNKDLEVIQAQEVADFIDAEIVKDLIKEARTLNSYDDAMKVVK